MTREEYLAHSEEWQKGFTAYANRLQYDETASDEWKDGYCCCFGEAFEANKKDPFEWINRTGNNHTRG